MASLSRMHRLPRSFSVRNVHTRRMGPPTLSLSHPRRITLPQERFKLQSYIKPLSTSCKLCSNWNSYNEVPVQRIANSNATTKTDVTAQTIASEFPVVVPEDNLGIIKRESPAGELLAQPGLVIVRQFEMLNLFIGYEQANRYKILNAAGDTVGYLLEEDLGFASNVGRQVFRTHRAFKCIIMDNEGNVILRINRPFSFINSRIYITSEDENNVIGEAQQQWHPWRRKYDLFQRRGQDEFEQFAKIDAPLFSWEFVATTEDGRPMASIDRNFSGFGRELFTDTGEYNLRFDAVSQVTSPQSNIQQDSNTNVPANIQQEETSLSTYTPQPLTLDQRAIMLASAVCIDFDYFTRHNSGGVGMPIPMPIGGMGGFGVPGEGEAEAEEPVSTTSTSDIEQQPDQPQELGQQHQQQIGEEQPWWMENQDQDAMQDPWLQSQKDEVMNDPWDDNDFWGDNDGTWGSGGGDGDW